MAGGAAIEFPELHGRALITASGNRYLPFIKQPVLVYKAENNEQIKRAFNRAKERELNIGIYSYPLFLTHTEDENFAETANIQTRSLTWWVN